MPPSLSPSEDLGPGSTLVTGGTGWIGSQLITKLARPVVVSRNLEKAAQQTGLPIDQVIECDLGSATIPRAKLSGVDTVVNLMGDSIATGRWNDAKKKQIRDSRIKGTSHLVHSILQCDPLPHTFISSSATGYYGDRGEQILKESDRPGNDFLSQVCVDWENAARPLIDAGIRVCSIRTGIVLGKGGGAMEKMLTPFRLGVGGRLGSGEQWMSWIHSDDLIDLILFLLGDEKISGPLNATAPNPVRNSEFASALGSAVGRPAIIPVPKFALKIALGEFANFLVASQRAVPAAAESHGFEFRYPTIEEALYQVVR